MEQYTDLTFLRTFTGGNNEKMKKYINLFLGAAEPAIDSINKYLADADWPALKTAAHSLKSQVKYMGIKQAEELSFFIEQSAGSQTGLEKIPEAAANLASVTKAACAELRQVLDGL